MKILSVVAYFWVGISNIHQDRLLACSSFYAIHFKNPEIAQSVFIFGRNFFILNLNPVRFETGIEYANCIEYKI